MRHEQKYMIGKPECTVLKSILSASLRFDPHYKDGRYTVTSLYFDDISLSAYYEKLDGDSDREKFRIRLYNGDETYIVLEKKCKKNDLVDKYSLLLHKNSVRDVICGGSLHESGALAEEFEAKRIAQGLKPIANIAYDRTAFVFPAGETRITIDENIRFSLDKNSLFDKTAPFIPVFSETAVLEVKYSDVFPSFLTPILSSVSAERIAYSKYAMAVSAIEGSNI